MKREKSIRAAILSNSEIIQGKDIQIREYKGLFI